MKRTLKKVFKKRKLLLIALPVLVLFLLYLGSFVYSYNALFKSSDPLLVTDVARLIPTRVEAVDTVNSVEQLQKIIKEAQEKHLKVTISGSRHSQGGHIFYPGAVMLDMRGFNKVLSLDKEKKILRVQSGARWKEIQEYINPYGLAVKTMQSSYVFTVGGTLSANAHGRDMDSSSVVETVESFRLLTADGKIKNVSRAENPELFKLVIGGYGLFGVILDVDLKLTDNSVYVQKSTVIDYRDFPDYFYNHVKNDPKVRMMLVRPSISQGTLLRELVVTTWNATTTEPKGVFKLRYESNVIRDKFFFSLSRKYEWAKSLRWTLQKKIESGIGETRIVSRTNAMRPPLAPLEFLDYNSNKDTDIIQEYYVPVRNFVTFMDSFRDILTKNKINTISFTIRYVKANNETYMAYAPKEDTFAVIQMSNVGLDSDSQAHVSSTTRELVDAAIKNNGAYYLTYQLYPTKEQIYTMYPNAKLFFAKKKQYDPEELFTSTFYEKYK